MSSRYKNSEDLLSRARKVIPGGTQTFSKSFVQYPIGVSPFYATHGSGSRLWDVDGNEYIDFVSGLLSVNLGYADPDVDAAVHAQLGKGVTFTLPTEIEIEVAEQIVAMVPCAEMVRFGKNGSDATAGAVRLARAFTGRSRVAVAGYHGWQDWYIGTTSRDLGVPPEIKSLTQTFAYNDLSSLEQLLTKHKGEYACVVMEPSNVTAPTAGFLEGVRDLCTRHGTLLVFDEIITGFRFSNGGAQELYGVTPDLTALGKGLANGYPLSAVVGRSDIMQVMEDIFYSFTMGSEAISLVAAKATLDKIQREPVTAHYRNLGSHLTERINELIVAHGMQEYCELAGHPAWTFLLFKDTGVASAFDIKSLWMQECLQRGILTLGSHNLNYAHSLNDVEKLTATYDEVFEIISKSIVANNLQSRLRCEPLKPLFRVR